MRKFLTLIMIILSIICMPFSMDQQKIVEYNKPSVVLIYIDISGEIAFSQPTFNQQAFQALQQEIIEKVYSGALGTTEEEVKRNAITYILKKMAENPNRFLIPSRRQKKVQVNTGAVGSGVIINPNGYILTATHVVAFEEDELKQMVANKFLSEFITEDFYSSFEQEAGVSLTPEEEKLLAKVFMGYVLSNITDFNYQKRVYVGLGVAEKGTSNVSAFFKPANLIKIGSAEKVSDIVDMGRDIAIIKIDQNNLPTSIISEHEPTEGSEITVIGYPAQVHFFAGSLFDNFSVLKPTVTKGIVSALRTSNKGVRVIQTDATISGGNSGGPAYGSEGKIIGTVSWGINNPQVGVATQNYNILVSCAEIQNFIKEANIQNIQSDVDKNYSKGIDEYFEQRYRNAMRYFKKVQELYPDHPYVKEYIINCQTNIDQGKDKSGFSFQGNTAIILLIVAVIFCGGLFLIAAAIVAYFLFFRKKQTNT